MFGTLSVPTQSGSTGKSAVNGAQHARHRRPRAATHRAARESMVSTIEEPPFDGAGDCATCLHPGQSVGPPRAELDTAGY
jgi:hypothetical protein